MSSGVFNRYTGYHNRQSIRLSGYDYSRPGYYFITICIHDRRQRIFGDIIDKKMVLNELGKIAHNHFECLPGRFPNIKLDEFQIMPNHVHAVIPVVIPVGATLAVAHDFIARDPQNANSCIANDHPVIHNNTPVSVTQTGTVKWAGASPAPTVIPAVTTKTGKTKNVTVGDIVGAYKSLVANECLKIYKSENERMGKLWQRNYYDHIIRNEKSLFRIRKYIRENPLRWNDDLENHIDGEIREFHMVEMREDL